MNTLIIGIYGKSIVECQSLFQMLKYIQNEKDIRFNVSIENSCLSLLKNHKNLFDIVFLILDDCVFFSGYKYKTVNYLKKPFSYKNVLEEIDKFLDFEFLLQEPYFLYSSQKMERKIYYRKLRYIETGNRQLIFHYDRETISCSGSLADLEKKLCPKTFFRCNNSYLVNVFYVEEIIPDVHRYKIRLITGEEIPLSRNKKNDLVKLMTPEE